MAGDVEEDYRRLAAHRGRGAAARWLLAETVRNGGRPRASHFPNMKGVTWSFQP